MRKYILVMSFLLFLCLSIIRTGNYIYGENGVTQENDGIEKKETLKESELYAKAAVLIDGDSGRVLYEKNADEQLAMASTTKIMTCIIALEYGNLGDEVMVTGYAQAMPKVKLGMQEGEKYRLKDLLYSLMLESHNDSAVAIAEHIGGSVEGFAKMMNEKARELGCYNTYFITPNGLDDKTEVDGKVKVHSTTANDLARIMKYCINESAKKEEFLTITRTSSYSFSNIEGKRSFNCVNHNAFLNMMEGALSGKTGFTGDAGYCYVGALKRGEKTYIVALLACGWPNNKTYKWKDAKKLMNYGLDNFESIILEDTGLDYNKLGAVPVHNAQTEEIGETRKISLELEDDTDEITKVLMRDTEKVEIAYDISKELYAPVKNGETVGTIQYLVDGKVWKKVNVLAAEKVEKIDFKWSFEKILKKFCLNG